MLRPVEVTWHAYEQFRERFPEEAGSGSYTRLLIAEEIEHALDEGRYATKQPKWSGRRSRGRRNGNELDRTMRYCWVPDQRRLYLVDRRNGIIRAITTIRPSIG